MPLRGWWRWLCQVFVCEHGEGGGDGANDPEGADQVSEHVSDDYDVHREIDDCERTGEGKGPGSPGGDEAQPTKHDADKHGARQVADDVDEQVDEHDGVAVEVRPERSELRCAAGLGDIVGQGVDADQRGPGDPADEGERRRDRCEPGCAPHAEQRHAQVTQGQEEGGSNGAYKVQGVASRTGHGAGNDRTGHGAVQDDRLWIFRPRQDVEGDAQRCEDDAGRKARALEFESGGHWRLFCMRWRSFHLVVPFLCVI